MSDNDPKKMKILLVEDQTSMRKIEIKIFKSLGFENITEAEDGSVAIDLLQDSDDFDLIVSDWNMPNKGGYELLVWVRAYKKYKDIPFIMATAQADRAQAEKAHNAGVSGFIPKPFTAEDLQQKIDEVFGNGSSEDEPSSRGPVMGSSGKVKLRVAHIQITDHLILGVLKDKIDRGEFSPKYFELETQRMAGWNPVEQALDKGSVDAAFVLAPIAQDLYAHGVPIKLTLLAHKNGSTFVRNSNGLYVPPYADFYKNKSFLIPHKLSVHHMLSHMFLEKIGLNGSLNKGDDVDVNFEVVAPINMPGFLGDNQDVCGFMVAEPIGSNSVAAGLTKMQFLSGELWQNHPCCVVAFRDDFSGPHNDAVHEFTQMLVEAGNYISESPESAADIGVKFLDPEGQLGLAAPVLTKVLSEPHGITTNDLFPVLQDFDNMQRYMHDTMSVGTLIDLEKFIDTSYAEAACQNLQVETGKFKNSEAEIETLLTRGSSQPKSMSQDKTVGDLSVKDPKHMKILLVEDQASMRKIEIKIFKSLGFENITEAEDGSVAIDLLQDSDDFDLIVSDWNMPNKGGYELLVWVRAYKKYKDIPFIMATAQADRAQAEKAHNAGVSGFIPKPFTAEDLQQKIDEVFGNGSPKADPSSCGPVMGSSGKVKLRVAHIQITDHLILGVLKDKIDRGEFSPKYFELETQRMTGWNPVEQALDKGSVDAAFVLAPIAQDLYAHGVPIKLTLLAHKNGSTFVRNSNGFYVPPFADFFRNKSFLIPHKLSVHHMLAHMFLEKIGLNGSLNKGDDVHVNFEVVAPINMPGFLGDNQDVCGFMVAEPIGSNSVAAGLTKMQFLSGELWENHPCCVVAFRDDFSGPHNDAVHEFTQMLVEAGNYIAESPESAADIGVKFLDPEGQLGLAAPVLTKVLSEPHGITTNDLFPVLQDFENMQRYMHDTMGVGTLIDLEKFIDTSYAEAACKNIQVETGKFRNSEAEIEALLLRGAASTPFKLYVENGQVMVYRI